MMRSRVLTNHMLGMKGRGDPSNVYGRQLYIYLFLSFLSLGKLRYGERKMTHPMSHSKWQLYLLALHPVLEWSL